MDMSSMAAILVAVMPVVVIVVLLRLSERIHRERDAHVARQVELTDAIHRELGAVVAPTVEKHRGGRWVVRMAVPLHDPELVMTLLTVTGQVFARHDAEQAVEITLTPQPESVASAIGRSRASSRRMVPLAAAAR